MKDNTYEVLKLVGYKPQNDAQRTVLWAGQIVYFLTNGSLDELCSRLGDELDITDFLDALRNIGAEEAIAPLQNAEIEYKRYVDEVEQIDQPLESDAQQAAVKAYFERMDSFAREIRGLAIEDKLDRFVEQRASELPAAP